MSPSWRMVNPASSNLCSSPCGLMTTFNDSIPRSASAMISPEGPFRQNSFS